MSRISYKERPSNLEFKYSTELEKRELVGGGYTQWENAKITAISPPNLTLEEAIEFYRLVSDSLPQGWAGDPEITEIFGGKIAITGWAD